MASIDSTSRASLYNSEYNFSNISNTFNQLIANTASQLYDDLQSFSGQSLDSGTMIEMQSKLQQYSVAIEMHATLNKHLGDMLKAVVQKMT